MYTQLGFLCVMGSHDNLWPLVWLPTETSQDMGLPGNQTAAASFTIKTEPQEQVIMPAAMWVYHQC